jgi:RNA-directed DNA polymerase
LGFVHICSTTRGGGRFQLRRVTIAKRMHAKLHDINVKLKRMKHLPIPVQGAWLASVVRGYYAYYAVPVNGRAMSRFRYRVIRLWFAALRRRSQRTSLTWDRMNRLAAHWIPPVRIQHPWPERRFDAKTQGRSPVR